MSVPDLLKRQPVQQCAHAWRTRGCETTPIRRKRWLTIACTPLVASAKRGLSVRNRDHSRAGALLASSAPQHPRRCGTTDTSVPAWDGASLLLPIDILQAQSARLTGAQAVHREQQHNGTVALVRRVLALGRPEQALDILRGQRRGNRLASVHARHDGQARHAPAAPCGVTEEYAVACCVAADRSPSTSAAGALFRDEPIQVRDTRSLSSPNRLRNSSTIQQRLWIVLASHPVGKRRDLGHMLMARNNRWHLQAAQEAQPPRCPPMNFATAAGCACLPDRLSRGSAHCAAAASTCQPCHYVAANPASAPSQAD